MDASILLIEDDPILAENTKELLELSRYHVYTALNGKDGLQMAREKVPDLIVSDIMMPQLDGYQVYEALQRSNQTRGIPFIFLSAKADPADVRKGMNLGADDYITKPFREEDLILAIERRLAKHAWFKKHELKNGLDTKSGSELEELREHFRSYGTQVEVAKHEEIYWENRNASNVYLISEGLIKTYRLDEHGKELITGIPKKGEVIGFYSFNPPCIYPETAEALENTVLYKISTEEFVQLLLNNQDLTVAFAQLLNDHLSILKTHLLDMAYSSVLKKTTNTILQFAEEIQEDPEQFIKVSRSDLASVAGISTESFIRSLSLLRKEGLIEIVGRNIKILDHQKLHAIK